MTLKERIEELLSMGGKGGVGPEALNIFLKDIGYRPDEIQHHIRVMLDEGFIRLGKELRLYSWKL